jgi:hypothetical protein
VWRSVKYWRVSGGRWLRFGSDPIAPATHRRRGAPSAVGSTGSALRGTNLLPFAPGHKKPGLVLPASLRIVSTA